MLQVRQAKTSDADLICEIESQSFVHNAYDKQTLLAEIKNANRMFLVAEKAQKIIGYLDINLLPDVSEIIKVAVSLQHRRQGVLKVLLTEAIALLKLRGYNSLLLEVSNTNNNAIVSYENLGFSKINVRHNYYADGSDAFIYNMQF